MQAYMCVDNVQYTDQTRDYHHLIKPVFSGHNNFSNTVPDRGPFTIWLVSLHHMTGVPSPYDRGPFTIWQVSLHHMTGVPSPYDRGPFTIWQVSLHHMTGVPSPYDRCPFTIWQVSLHHMTGVPSPYDRCPFTIWLVSLHHMTGVPSPYDWCPFTIWQGSIHQMTGVDSPNDRCPFTICFLKCGRWECSPSILIRGCPLMRVSFEDGFIVYWISFPHNIKSCLNLNKLAYNIQEFTLLIINDDQNQWGTLCIIYFKYYICTYYIPLGTEHLKDPK